MITKRNVKLNKWHVTKYNRKIEKKGTTPS